MIPSHPVAELTKVKSSKLSMTFATVIICLILLIRMLCCAIAMSYWSCLTYQMCALHGVTRFYCELEFSRSYARHKGRTTLEVSASETYGPLCFRKGMPISRKLTKSCVSFCLFYLKVSQENLHLDCRYSGYHYSYNVISSNQKQADGKKFDNSRLGNLGLQNT